MTKTIVVPGEQIYDRAERGFGTYIENNKTYSKYLGVLYNAEETQVVPLSGKYFPKENDQIIGVIAAEDSVGYIMDVKSYHMPYVHKRSIKTELKKGDLLLCQVVSVNEIKDMTIDIQAKLDDGILLNVSAKKVPRVIGKHRSMITLLEKFSGSKILVGANGNLFVQGGKPNIVKNALDIISKYSHVDNLTDKMNIYLQKIK